MSPVLSIWKLDERIALFCTIIICRPLIVWCCLPEVRPSKMAVPDTANHAKDLKYQLEFGSQGIVPATPSGSIGGRDPLDIDENLIRLADSKWNTSVYDGKEGCQKNWYFCQHEAQSHVWSYPVAGAVRDYSGISHDTISQRFKTYAPEKLSKLTIDIQRTWFNQTIFGLFNQRK